MSKLWERGKIPKVQSPWETSGWVCAFSVHIQCNERLILIFLKKLWCCDDVSCLIAAINNIMQLIFSRSKSTCLMTNVQDQYSYIVRFRFLCISITRCVLVFSIKDIEVYFGATVGFGVRLWFSHEGDSLWVVLSRAGISLYHYTTNI